MTQRTAQAGEAPAPPGLTEIIDIVIDLADRSKTVTIGAVIKAVGKASFAPILLLPALAVATPLSGIPLFSSMMGILIFLVATQMLLLRDQLWLPGWLLRREVRTKIVRDAFIYIRPVAAWFENRSNRRLSLIVRRPLVFIPQMLCVISGAVLPLLEIVPFTSSVVGIGVAILAFGMLSRDGLIVLLGLVPYGVLAWLISIAAS